MPNYIVQIDVFRPCPASRYSVQVSTGPRHISFIADDIPLTRAEEIAHQRKEVFEENGRQVSLTIDTR